MLTQVANQTSLSFFFTVCVCELHSVDKKRCIELKVVLFLELLLNLFLPHLKSSRQQKKRERGRQARMRERERHLPSAQPTQSVGVFLWWLSFLRDNTSAAAGAGADWRKQLFFSFPPLQIELTSWGDCKDEEKETETFNQTGPSQDSPARTPATVFVSPQLH